MNLRTRLSSSSPTKTKITETKTSTNRCAVESSDWSSSSPISTRLSMRSSSPSLSGTNSRPIASSPRKSSNWGSSDLDDTDSELDEKENDSILQIPIPSKTLRPHLLQVESDESEEEGEEGVEGETEGDNSMIDIMSQEPEQESEDEGEDEIHTGNLSITSEITDPTLQGLLEDEEIDLEDSKINESDRKLFEIAFNRAEMPNLNSSTSLSNNTLKSRIAKPQSRPSHAANNSSSSSSSSNPQGGVRGKGKDLFNVLKQRVRGPTVPSIRKVYFGTDVSINPWYSAPYPSEYHTASGELWICEFCLQYMKKPCQAQRHLLKCHGCLPPGDEIYRDPIAGISVFEVNGRDAKLYCQNLCLLAKMFLDHKTLYYDVDPFLFYVLIEWKSLGTGRFLNSFVGYFSKEKINPAGFNVSCILTMPHHQRKGYGSFLIDFSYLLSRKEGRPGSPEKPLSDLGLFSYVSYWKSTLLSHFSSILPDDLPETTKIQIPTISRISSATGMTENDILSTLEHLRMLRFEIVFNDPSDGSKQSLAAEILIDLALIESFRAKIASRPHLNAHEEYLRWQPYNCTK